MPNLVGQVLKGRYRVDEFIDRGGMAEVYKVWDLERSSYLAMKLLPEDLAEDQVFIRRFKREAQALSRLQHPNIVRFYGLEEDRHYAFILMDFIDGSSLRREIAETKNPFSPQRIMEYMNAICPALYFAHSEGYVHCDIKPANVLVKRSGQILLTDFGIAQNTEATATMTMVGAGTVAFMSPEQARGEMPTPQSDIYSLGIVLFEMLTAGQRPFTGEKARISGTLNERVRWEQKNLPAPSPQIYNPNIPAQVAAVVLQCLEKDPFQRFANALAVLYALKSAFGQYEIPSQPPPPKKSFWQNLNKPPLWAGGIVIVSAFLIWLFIKTPPPRVVPTPFPTMAPTTTRIPATVSPYPSPTFTKIPTLTPRPSFTPYIAAQPACHSVGDKMVSTKDNMTLVCVSTGYYQAYWIDQTEVTNQMYQKCVAAGACTTPGKTSSLTRTSYYGNLSFSNYPVVYISWYDARDYCTWAGRRLPTKAEWENAASGPSGWQYPWGNSDPSPFVANYADSGIGDTTLVGNYSNTSSYFGTYDMAGNVREWVDFSFDGFKRVVKGGSFDVDAEFLKIMHPSPSDYDPGAKSPRFGIRCAMNANP